MHLEIVANSSEEYFLACLCHLWESGTCHQARCAFQIEDSLITKVCNLGIYRHFHFVDISTSKEISPKR